VAVDGESWTLVWWYLGEQGVLCECSVSGGGRAIQEALAQVQRLQQHQRDGWHVLRVASQVQGCCDRALQQMQERLAILQRQAERVAQGKKARGRAPLANVAIHEQRPEALWQRDQAHANFEGKNAMQRLAQALLGDAS
jgi:hypothetical protein